MAGNRMFRMNDSNVQVAEYVNRLGASRVNGVSVFSTGSDNSHRGGFVNNISKYRGGKKWLN